jgi:peptidoglycan/LPS O-acetylase OafA/YrhL
LASKTVASPGNVWRGMGQRPTTALEPASSRLFLRGIYATVVIMLVMGVGFTVHEQPPTSRHLAAAALLGGSALVLLIGALLLTPTQAHGWWLMVGQLVATGVLIVVLASQQVDKSAAWWVLGAAITVGPVAYSAVGWSRYTRR